MQLLMSADQHGKWPVFNWLLTGTKPFLAHIHGHSHAGFGRNGKHFNVASAGRQRAMVLDTETMKHEVLDLEPRKIEA